MNHTNDPVPRCSSQCFGSRGGGRKDEQGLERLSRSFLLDPETPTPGKPPSPSDQSSRRLWRSPTACTDNSLRGSGQDAKKREAQGHNVNLQDQAHTAMGCDSKRRLSPLFVEWLMGWPPHWSTARIDSACSATAWSRWWQQSRSVYCATVWNHSNV